MNKLNNSKRAIKGTITKIETFVEESGNHTPTKLDIKLKRVQEMNRKIDELKDQYYDIKDISESELQVIEADIQNRETRKQFEQSIDSNQIPELDTFIMFLEKRSQTIDSINRSAPITHKPKQVPFHKGEIGMLIGCELFFELLRPNKFRSPCEKWLFQETVFGYIVVGSFDKFEENSYCGLAINAEINSNSLNQQLQAFWEIEKLDKSSIEHCLEEEICETQYQNIHYRTEEGRYVVQLPLKKIHTV
ncbi:uncharacterized protein TNCV_3245181 [Trichonephila clavipes]|nr:uncharacterized protein TNCV_3245181 [Trichonephila clavipes]